MLAPVTEVEYGEDDLLALNLAGVNAWPAFAAELEELTGLSAGSAPDRHPLGRVRRRRRGRTPSARRLPAPARTRGRGAVRSRRASTRAPARRGRLRWRLGPGDHSVDNRQAVAALLRAIDLSGVQLIRQRVARVITSGTTAVGVLLDNGDTVHAGHVIVRDWAVVVAVGRHSR